MRRVVLLALVPMLVLAIGRTTDAEGRVMRVYTCMTPDGRGIGPSISDPANSGWQMTPTITVLTHQSDSCPVGAGFLFWLSQGHLANGAGVWAQWEAADGTQLVGIDIAYSADSQLFSNPGNQPGRGHGSLQFQVATDQQLLLASNGPGGWDAGVSSSPRFVQAVRPSRYFRVGFACPADCVLGTDGGSARILQARFEVDDATPPVGGLVGSAADAHVWSGSPRLLLNAVDRGVGIARVVLVVDASDAVVVPLGDARCRDIGNEQGVGEYAFPRPCPLRLDGATVDLDTAALPQGRHEVQIAVEDAAGNRTTVFGPVMRTIAANGPIGPGSDLSLRGPANGEGASDQARLTAHWGRRKQRSRLVSRFGRKHVVYGRLVGSDGAPIANAALDVVSRTTAVNARELAKRNGPVTGADGRWSMTLPRAVSSRDVAFRYRSHAGDTVATAIASVRLRVRAGLWMTIRPRVARRGQAIRFSGRLLGGPLPPGGKQVVLVARGSKGPWLRFNVVRTDAAGRFRATYRFQQTGLVRYRFRALSRAEAVYPYLAGGSNIVRVVKR